jgi:hypothetical protein
MRFGRAATFVYEAAEPNSDTVVAKYMSFHRADVNEHALLDKIRPLIRSLVESYNRADHVQASQYDSQVKAHLEELNKLLSPNPDDFDVERLIVD